MTLNVAVIRRTGMIIVSPAYPNIFLTVFLMVAGADKRFQSLPKSLRIALPKSNLLMN